MYKKTIQDMNLAQIASSGQCFRWEEVESNTYVFVAFEKFIRITQEEDKFTFSCDQKEFEEVWYQYFDLKTDYSEIKALIDPDDRFLKNALDCGDGVRILRQDLWEMLISFIISQNNNIPRIKKSIRELCRQFGEKGVYKDIIYHTFPTPRSLSLLEESQLRSIGLGYRASYILDAVDWWLARKYSESVEDLESMGYENAMEQLMEIKGVGRKVADCICLFGLHYVEAFPIDTHIKKILQEYYPKGFPFERYNGYGGIVQQWMFYHDLKK